MRRAVIVAVMTALLTAAGSGVPSARAATAPTVSPDQALALKINTALRRDRYLAYRKVRAEARDGEALLTGSVLTDFEKAHAATVAGGVPGVKSVKNRLLVIRYPASYESDLARRIREALSRDPTARVTELAIETDAHDGVILHGIVASAELKALIGKDAAAVKGVRRVVNDLEVEQTEPGTPLSHG
jgi:hyperosmotically inducible periplasmic protein